MKKTLFLLAAIFTLAFMAPAAMASEGTLAVQPTARSASTQSTSKSLPKGITPRSDVPDATVPVVEVDNDQARLLIRYKASDSSSYMVRIIAPGGAYVDYTLYAVNADEYFPLTGGNGAYEAWILRVTGDGKAQVVNKTTVTLQAKDKNAAYLSSNLYVNWEGATDAQKYVDKLSGGKQSKGGDSIAATIYQEVVNMMNYDYSLVGKLESGYLADIDKTLQTKKGICYDTSTLLAGMLRYSDVPTRVVIGYAKSVGTDYMHAWNEAYIDGEWVIIDATEDSILQKGSHSYSMEKKSGDFKEVRSY